MSRSGRIRCRSVVGVFNDIDTLNGGISNNDIRKWYNVI